MVFAKDTEHAYLYSLGEFSAAEDGIRETTDLIEKYKRGLLGALPKPDLFSSLYEVCSFRKHNKRQEGINHGKATIVSRQTQSLHHL